MQMIREEIEGKNISMPIATLALGIAVYYNTAKKSFIYFIVFIRIELILAT